ncbi:MAG: metallophosphoesterase family protein [Acidobacteriota bacterium]
MRRSCFYLFLITGFLFSRGPREYTPIEAPPPGLVLPLEEDSVRFAVIGDAGTGDQEQYEVARRMQEYHALYPYEFVILLGDNMYGGEDPDDYRRKFEDPYQGLLDQNVKFYASLGNHDEPAQRFYELFNMGGERYYTFKYNSVRFFALDSDYFDPEQLSWLEEELEKSGSDWKICFFHHPIYSSGATHGPDEALRQALEPLFMQYGVNVVFAGHEHFYERIKPQNGIYYFISGAGGKLRRGDIRTSPLTASGFDQDNSFMLVEIVDDSLYFQVISRAGQTVDSGVLGRQDIQESRMDVGTASGEWRASANGTPHVNPR